MTTLAELRPLFQKLERNLEAKTDLLNERIDELQAAWTDRDSKRRASTKRAANIAALAELSGLHRPGELSAWLNNDQLSVADVASILQARCREKSSAPGDDYLGEQNIQAPSVDSIRKADAKLRKEYDELGFKGDELSFDAYKKHAEKNG